LCVFTMQRIVKISECRPKYGLHMLYYMLSP
jgi:hypothetical protein